MRRIVNRIAVERLVNRIAVRRVIYAKIALRSLQFLITF